MQYRRHIVAAALCASLCIGCATSPDTGPTREDVAQAIDRILTEAVDTGAELDTKRCLGPQDYDHIRILNDRHLLFDGRRDKYWVNTLRVRCLDLKHATVLRIRSTSSIGRICNLDSFQAGDWFDWPWYRRWPWRWGATWGTGTTCYLGKFQRVTAEQVRAIEEVLP